MAVKTLTIEKKEDVYKRQILNIIVLDKYIEVPIFLNILLNLFQTHANDRNVVLKDIHFNVSLNYSYCCTV